jgi:hypothetical protein
VIVFKGPVSTYHLYKTPGLREFADLDLLIDSDDVHRASQLLVSFGLQPPAILNTNQTKALVRYRNEMSFSSREMPLHVDLHWKLLYQCFDLGVDPQVLMERSVEVAVEGRSVRTLSQADFLYYLGMRAAVDCWSSIYRLVDLAAAVKTMSPADVYTAIERASAVAKRRVMEIGLVLVQGLLGVSLPESCLDKRAPGRATHRLVKRATGRLITQPEFEPSLIGTKLIGFQALERTRDKACILLWLAFSPGPSDIGVMRLPARLVVLYRVVRLLRAAAKYLRRPFFRKTKTGLSDSRPPADL